jgi:hypothetical protein
VSNEQQSEGPARGASQSEEMVDDSNDESERIDDADEYDQGFKASRLAG